MSVALAYDKQPVEWRPFRAKPQAGTPELKILVNEKWLRQPMFWQPCKVVIPDIDEPWMDYMLIARLFVVMAIARHIDFEIATARPRRLKTLIDGEEFRRQVNLEYNSLTLSLPYHLPRCLPNVSITQKPGSPAEKPLKALSIRQPWAWAITHAGKDVENRDWNPRNPGRRFRGEFLIHASSGMTRREHDDFIHFVHAMSLKHPFPEGLAVPAIEDLPRGGIVGVATVTDIVHESASPWFFGPLGLCLTKVSLLKFIPCKGALGFFEPPADIYDRIEWRTL
jgi:hypothetical protein